MKTVIIIPTYNEKDTIGRLIEELQQQFVPIRHSMHILVVDDDSPDGTGKIVRDLQGRYDTLHLLSGQRSGLGTAYIRGIKHAIEHLGAQAVFEMDADLSHDPKDIPRFLDGLDKGADFVIGSRYVPGGSIPKRWSWIRRWMSRYGNFVVRFVLRIQHVRDCTSGFRAIRTSLLEQIPVQQLNVQGYTFQIALLYEAVLRKAIVREIPIHFIDRSEGVSKLGIPDILEFIVSMLKFRFWGPRTFINSRGEH